MKRGRENIWFRKIPCSNSKKMSSKLNHIIEIIIQILFKFIGVGWAGRRTVSSEVRYVKSIIRDGDVFVDCGANKGNYSYELIRHFNNPVVHVFEPSFKNMEFLLKRFRGNRNIKINHLGLSDKNRDSILYSNESGSALASLKKRKLDHHHIKFDFQEKRDWLHFRITGIKKLILSI